MSALNGDRARFQRNRQRKMLRRQRIQALVIGLRKTADQARVSDRVADADSRSASLAMHDEGGPARAGD